MLTDELRLDLTGWQLSGARGISADGTVIVGFGTNPGGQTEGWIADLNLLMLEIARVGPDLVLSWKTDAPNVVLEQTLSLGSGSVWTTNSATPYRRGDSFVVTNTPAVEQTFFRLKQP
jgi:hypothetical protein